MEQGIIKNGNAFLRYSIGQKGKDAGISIDAIKYGNIMELGLLIDRLVVRSRHLNLPFLYRGDCDLTEYHFLKDQDCYILPAGSGKIRRFVKIGDGETGPLNKITDVKGVKVGHYTLHRNDYHTGITVIKPHEGNIFEEKVIASSYVFNGFGKTTGLPQIEETGTIETHIAFTSTLSVSKTADAMIGEALRVNPEIGMTAGTVNPVVMECNDGELNKSRERILSEKDYLSALEDARQDFPEGAVGAGSGMICHGFKGGIGSSSRVLEIEGKKYTIGIIMNTNFGRSGGKDLIFTGRKFQNQKAIEAIDDEEKGSVVGVLATDLPVNERQLKRLLKRIEIGIGRTGSYAGVGSGDIFIGFTTADKVSSKPDALIRQVNRLHDKALDLCFRRVTEMTEEAVLNALLFSENCHGYRKDVVSLKEFPEFYEDLLTEKIEYEI